jgi:2-phospho-L-lactate/phosphoenolpyruvate guanylyltransferase
MSTVAVIPVKHLVNAKQRLAGLLRADQRKALFRAMFMDVLEATTSCDCIDRVVVVTNDLEVTDLGTEFGVEVRAEPATGGLIGAVTEAGRQLAAEGVDNMLFLPADVPLVTVEELEVVLDGFDESPRPAFMIVPAHDLGGSNCVVCSPPDCVEFGFGEDSFRRHLRLARAAGIDPMVAKLIGIGQDVDTPDDLVNLVKVLEHEQLDTNTARFLVESGLAEALACGLARTE